MNMTFAEYLAMPGHDRHAIERAKKLNPQTWKVAFIIHAEQGGRITISNKEKIFDRCSTHKFKQAA